ncbi:hypothetical protein HHUSO_G9891 [Huso huso]|uniref:Ig-like domain-containing protein n=1 Tax=Huso huso TaxID=61971 RepID=A0ABR0ZNB7_HUSHU
MVNKTPYTHILLWILVCTELEVQALVCRYSEVCTLPCDFTPGSGIVIHWQKIPRDIIVHSFYYEQDQLGTQNEQYQGRTSIFKEELDNGNASLLLRDIRMADKGTYHCYVSTDQRKNEAHVTVEVKAPIRSLSLVYNSVTEELTCSSRDIYPAPTLRWTASHDDAAPTQIGTQLNKEGLYSVNSTLRIPHDRNATEQYICTIVSSGDQTWEGSWKKQESIQSLETQTAVIPCNISENHQEFTLIWSVMRDGNLTTVVEYQSSTKTSLNSLDNAHVDEERINTGDGSLILQNLRSSNEGTYTCKYTASGVTHFIQTDLNIAKAGTLEGVGIIRVVVIWTVLVLALAVVLGLLYMFCIRTGEDSQNGKNREMEHVSKSHPRKKIKTLLSKSKYTQLR